MDHVTLRVHNEGPPSPARHLRAIFDPFRQLAPGRQPANVGLGLYIVQAIAAAHGGTVEVTSSDAGTTFTMRLPRVTSPVGGV